MVVRCNGPERWKFSLSDAITPDISLILIIDVFGNRTAREYNEKPVSEYQKAKIFSRTKAATETSRFSYELWCIFPLKQSKHSSMQYQQIQELHNKRAPGKSFRIF